MIKLAIVLASVAVACHGANLLTDELTRNINPNSYYVYTLDNPRQAVSVLPTRESILESPISGDRRTVILVHGHSGSAFTSLNPVVRDAILMAEDVNIIVVDWSMYAGLSYNVAVGTVPTVAQHLASFIEVLVAELKEVDSNTGTDTDSGTDTDTDTGTDTDTDTDTDTEVFATLAELHLVGFDLGAHVVGATGRALNGTVGRITGLDPSGSQWGSNSARLRITDALYVEVIHTDGRGIFANGIGTALGNVDFFANGGSNQPGCFSHSCCHDRAFELFAASMINTNLVGYPCSSNSQLNLNLCRGLPLKMGGTELTKIGAGIYRINTRRNFPF